MTTRPLCILLCSGEHEKIQMAAMMASVAAVSERPVQVLVSMNAVLAFLKEPPDGARYHGGTYSGLMLEKGAPDAVELFQQGKMLGDLQAHVCSMAMDVGGWQEGDLVDDLFDGVMGLTKFLSDAEQAQFITL